MGQGTALILDLVIILVTALVLGAILERFRQSAILGYMFAGMLLGPGAAKLVAPGPEVSGLAEMGVSLLLFTIGLEFSWKRLTRLGWGLLSGVIQILLTIGIGLCFGLLAGLSLQEALAVAMILSLASTAVVLRIFQERHEVESLHARISIGILLIQDLAVVPMLIILSVLPGGGTWTESFGSGILKSAAVVAVLTAAVGWLLPRLLDTGLVARNRELPVLLAISTCIGAAWSTHVAGLTPSLGAFLAGMLLADSKFADHIRADVLPFRTVMVTLFFASVGLVVDLGWLVQNLGLVVAVAAAVLVGKAAITFLAIRPFQTSIVYALAASIAISQVGEFSFVMAGVASSNGLLSNDLEQLIAATTVLTLLCSPLLVAKAPKIARRACRYLVPSRVLARAERAATKHVPLVGHAVVVGYGNAGVAAVSELVRCGVEVSIIDVQPLPLRAARDLGLNVHIGDAAQEPVLHAASLQTAACLVLAIPDHRAIRQVIHRARILNPEITIVARSRYHLFVDELLSLGVDEVLDEEVLTGTNLGRAAFRKVYEEPAEGSSLR